MRRSTPSRILTIAAANALMVAALLGLLELAARLFVDAPQRPLFDRPDFRVATRPFVEDHPSRGFALVPGFADPDLRINRDGLRGEELPAVRGESALILALGDSTTFGWGVRDHETWPYLLQSELRALATGGSPLVLNAGVPSYTSAQTLLYLRELIPRLEPDLAIVGGQWNDVWFSSLDPWFPEALILRAPSHWRRVLSEHSALYRWRTNPSSDGARDVVNEPALALYRDKLDAMARSCADHGVALVFLQPPLNRAAINPRGGKPLGQGFFSKAFVVEIGLRFAKVMREVAAQHGNLFIDHRLSIAHDPPARLFEDAFHPRRAGNLRIAQDVARALLAEGAVAGSALRR